MSVQKSSPARLRVERTPHTIVVNRVVQAIQNPDALAIWVYLQSKSNGWQVVAKHLRSHFGIGRDRYRAAMHYLADMGLVRYVPLRDEATGRMSGQEIVVLCEPREDTTDNDAPPREQESDPSASPRVQVSEGSETPSLGQPTPLRNRKRTTRKNPSKTQPNIDAVDARGEAIDEAFEIFWNAGLTKQGKKPAREKFETLTRQQADPLAFARQLADDIDQRLAAQLLGIDKLHPTTYLNQQRWLDPIRPDDAYACPHDALIDLWAEVMPEFQQHAKNLWPGSQRERDLEARWRAGFHIRHSRTGEPLYHDQATGLAWWRAFFEFLRKSDFLMDRPWVSLAWVAEREHFDAILDRKYHDRRAA